MRISDWSADVCSAEPSALGCECPPASALRPTPPPLFRTQGHSHPPFNLRGVQKRKAGLASSKPAIRSPARPAGRVGPVGLRRSTRSDRSEEHTSELQSLMRISYAVFCLKKKTQETLTN